LFKPFGFDFPYNIQISLISTLLTLNLTLFCYLHSITLTSTYCIISYGNSVLNYACMMYIHFFKLTSGA